MVIAAIQLATGWDLVSLRTVRTFVGVLRIDGIDLTEQGVFRQMHVTFATKPEADTFLATAAGMWDGALGTILA